MVLSLLSFFASSVCLVAELWSTRLSLHLGSNREHSEQVGIILSSVKSKQQPCLHSTHTCTRLRVLTPVKKRVTWA